MDMEYSDTRFCSISNPVFGSTSTCTIEYRLISIERFDQYSIAIQTVWHQIVPLSIRGYTYVPENHEIYQKTQPRSRVGYTSVQIVQTVSQVCTGIVLNSRFEVCIFTRIGDPDISAYCTDYSNMHTLGFSTSRKLFVIWRGIWFVSPNVTFKNGFLLKDGGEYYMHTIAQLVYVYAMSNDSKIFIFGLIFLGHQVSMGTFPVLPCFSISHIK